MGLSSQDDFNNIVITGNNIFDNTGAGIKTGGGSTQTATISANSINDNGSYGVNKTYATVLIVTSNDLTGNSTAATNGLDGGDENAHNLT